MKVGDVVEVTAGPFAGLHGRVKILEQRVVIVVEIKGRQLDVEMDLDWVSEAVRMTAAV